MDTLVGTTCSFMDGNGFWFLSLTYRMLDWIPHSPPTPAAVEQVSTAVAHVSEQVFPRMLWRQAENFSFQVLQSEKGAMLPQLR